MDKNQMVGASLWIKMRHRAALTLTVMVGLLLMPFSAMAWVNNDRFTVDGITFQVSNEAKLELSAVASTNAGTIVIPATVIDPNDKTRTYRVTAVGGWLGGRWDNATEVTVPEGVTTLLACALQSSSISSVHLPTSLTKYTEEAGTNALDGMSNLSTIDFPYGNSNFMVENNVLYNADKTQIYMLPAKNTEALDANGMFSVPNGVEIISSSAFNQNESLKKIYISESVNEIHTNKAPTMANGCKNLVEAEVAATNTTFDSKDGVLFNEGMTKLLFFPQNKCNKEGDPSYTVPTTVETIAEVAFMNCQGLTSITLSNVKTLETSAFRNTGISIFNIPATCTTITEGTFVSNTQVDKYVVADGNPNYSSDEAGVLFKDGGQTLYAYPVHSDAKTYTINDNVKTISNNAFTSSKLQEVVFGSNVAKIDDLAFRGCGQLSKITFKEPVEGVTTTIGSQVFEGCGKLKKVTIPAHVTTLGRAAFNSCGQLDSIVVADNSKLESIDVLAFGSCPKLAYITFGKNSALKTIKYNAFRESGLGDLVLPASLTTIEQNAFSNCKSLGKVTFEPGSTIETIAAGAFADSGIKEIELPSSVVTVEDDAFRKCEALEKVTLGTAAQNISSKAFTFCKKLETFEVAPDNQYYSSTGGMLLNREKETLVIFPPAKTNNKFTLLPPSITKIGDYAFYNCEGLTNVTIPTKVQSIGERAFGLCDNLNTVTFLCNPALPSSGINQEDSKTAFDEDHLNKIDIFVRKDQYGNYKDNTFYDKFHSIGTSFWAKNGVAVEDDAKGIEEYIPVSTEAVYMLSTRSTDWTYVIPEEVTVKGDSEDKTYVVSMLGDYLFEKHSDDVHEVVVTKNVGYIGARCFVTKESKDKSLTGSTEKFEPTSTIKNVFFIPNSPTKEMLSTTKFELDDTKTNYSEFAPTTNIFVKKSQVDNYKAAWKHTVKSSDAKEFNDHLKMIDYKIKDVTIGAEYATFAREFDVDLGDYVKSINSDVEAAEVSGAVYAFTGKSLTKYEGNGDYGTATHHVRMNGLTTERHAEGCYIPRGTGVLLKVWGDPTATPTEEGKEFYYCIGEDDINEEVENALKPVTVNYLKVEDISTFDYYVMSASKGVFNKIGSTPFSIKIHKAYMQFDKDSNTSNAKVVFDFGDDTTDGISAITTDNKADNAHAEKVYYNLSGQRIDHPTHGIYIVNGKKVVIK